MHTISERLAKVQDTLRTACEEAGRPDRDVTLVAVSKFRSVEEIREAIAAGQRHFGENRMQELRDKMDSIQDDALVWHLIGNVQSNKLRMICHRVDWIHSVDAVRHLHEIERRAGEHGRVVQVLIQVNISGEEQKGGVSPGELVPFLEEAAGTAWAHLRIRGFMGMASLTLDEPELHRQFSLLRSLRDDLRERFHTPSIDLGHLSMGMSGDMTIAIAEGATMIRVGSAIFG
jgi:hypothetical protein